MAARLRQGSTAMLKLSGPHRPAGEVAAWIAVNLYLRLIRPPLRALNRRLVRTSLGASNSPKLVQKFFETRLEFASSGVFGYEIWRTINLNLKVRPDLGVITW